MPLYYFLTIQLGVVNGAGFFPITKHKNLRAVEGG